MAAFAPITLTNNAGTNVVFNQTTIDSQGVARWMDNNAVYDARRQLSMQVTYPKNGSQVTRVKQKIVIPIMDTVDVTKKLGEAYINIEAVLPKISSDTVRLDARKFADGFLMNAVSTAAFQSYESIY